MELTHWFQVFKATCLLFKKPFPQQYGHFFATPPIPVPPNHLPNTHYDRAKDLDAHTEPNLERVDRWLRYKGTTLAFTEEDTLCNPYDQEILKSLSLFYLFLSYQTP